MSQPGIVIQQSPAAEVLVLSELLPLSYGHVKAQNVLQISG